MFLIFRVVLSQFFVSQMYSFYLTSVIAISDIGKNHARILFLSDNPYLINVKAARPRGFRKIKLQNWDLVQLEDFCTPNFFLLPFPFLLTSLFASSLCCYRIILIGPPSSPSSSSVFYSLRYWHFWQSASSWMVTNSKIYCLYWVWNSSFMPNRLTAKISNYNFELVGLVKDHNENWFFS